MSAFDLTGFCETKSFLRPAVSLDLRHLYNYSFLLCYRTSSH
jgi:hypothetical protein